MIAVAAAAVQLGELCDPAISVSRMNEIHIWNSGHMLVCLS